ncbi:MAG: diadenylate cyclase CdaA [Ignavibacteriaceae bacterium]|jgi:diadenylate cyclase
MFEIFKIGFITVSFFDLIDMAIVGIIFYKLYSVLKGTVASQIFLGLMLVFLLSFFSQILNLRAVNWLLKFITEIWIIAFIILFQPEIRRILMLLARSPILRFGQKGETQEVASIIAEAAFELSQFQHGALMVIVRSKGIRGISETGDLLNAVLSKDLLRTIFFPRTPLHDGAVIIKGNIIEAARCTLPLTLTTMYKGESLGMRHRAGLGISEQADVICVIVSEETGSISIAENGVLTRGLAKEMLRQKLIYVAPTKNKFKFIPFFRKFINR